MNEDDLLLIIEKQNKIITYLKNIIDMNEEIFTKEIDRLNSKNDDLLTILKLNQKN